MQLKKFLLTALLLTLILSLRLTEAAVPLPLHPALPYFTEMSEGRTQYIGALERHFKKRTFIKTGSEAERMRMLLTDLTSRLSMHGEHTVLLLNEKHWNAYALPGNIIVVTKGLADGLNDTELTALLLHELGHIALDHPGSALQRTKDAQKSLDKSAAFLEAGQYEAAAEEFVAAIYKGRVERSEEIAADVWAAEHLQETGLTAEEVTQYLRHAQKKLGDSFDGTQHPSFDERIRIFERVNKNISL
ncbi:hypothetical protein TAMA11512_15920 [Selenomonas sp. TAMA-11512]|uniref:M48 family metalloprotease n=1 Tax=Selenomonas sp. TAMA-11512 TaxID=3095337 RepID=UPI003085744F|nr:hypothetical protein TAMA11512_15920 [Selenomonas sp. TAMA-11512]